MQFSYVMAFRSTNKLHTVTQRMSLMTGFTIEFTEPKLPSITSLDWGEVGVCLELDISLNWFFCLEFHFCGDYLCSSLVPDNMVIVMHCQTLLSWHASLLRVCNTNRSGARLFLCSEWIENGFMLFLPPARFMSTIPYDIQMIPYLPGSPWGHICRRTPELPPNPGSRPLWSCWRDWLSRATRLLYWCCCPQAEEKTQQVIYRANSLSHWTELHLWSWLPF